MNRLKTVLKDRSGQGTPMILAVVVCCLILACVVFEYMRLPAFRFVLDKECHYRECV